MKKDPTDFSIIEVWKILYSKNIGTKKKPEFDAEETLYFSTQKECMDFSKKNVNDKITLSKHSEIVKFSLLNKRNCKGDLRQCLNSWDN